jgi:hypothetical protein
LTQEKVASPTKIVMSGKAQQTSSNQTAKELFAGCVGGIVQVTPTIFNEIYQSSFSGRMDCGFLWIFLDLRLVV